MRIFLRPLLCVVLSIGFAGSAKAGLVIHFGEDLTPDGTVPPEGNAYAARQSFYSHTTDVQTEDFESITWGSRPGSLNFVGPSGSRSVGINGNYSVVGADAGRFNTSPGASDYLYLKSANDVTTTNRRLFGLDYSDDPINAFGFYATDMGDIGGQVSIELTHSDSSQSTHFIPHTKKSTIGSPSENSGSLLFWGFTDPTNSYDKVEVYTTFVSDISGFDDMAIGSATAVPEPSAGLLLGPLLLALTWIRRGRAATRFCGKASPAG